MIWHTLLAVTSSPPVLLAQSGMAKSAIGWTLFALAFLLALLVICRPSGRKLPDVDKK
jgi:hypothetical protein